MFAFAFVFAFEEEEKEEEGKEALSATSVAARTADLAITPCTEPSASESPPPECKSTNSAAPGAAEHTAWRAVILRPQLHEQLG